MLGRTLDYRGAGVFRKVGFFCTDVEVTEVRSDQLFIGGVSSESRAKFSLFFSFLAWLFCILPPPSAGREQGKPWT
jgi:hypothetical protein